MRIFALPSVLALLIAAPALATAAGLQDVPPGVAPQIVPAPAPDAPDRRPSPLPGLPSPGGDRSPMIVPPPDEAPPDAPDAFGSAPSAADEAAPDAKDAPAAAADETPEQRLDRLFAELRRTAGEPKARLIASRIERQWRTSGSATVDLLMMHAAEAMAKKENAAALDMLDQALVLDPDYAEAWNRRATLNFMMERWGKSIADIRQTLAREPRHWGALMGLATILERTGHKDEALQTYLRVLEIYPALGSAQEAAGRLADELVGPAI